MCCAETALAFLNRNRLLYLDMLGADTRPALEALLRGVVSLALARGQYAYGQVFTDNAPSLALQRRAGMAVSEDILFWLF